MDKKELPVYSLYIDGESSFVSGIALVEEPAVESDWLTFSKPDAKDYTFSKDDQKILLGVAMRPNFRIYRKDVDGKEYYNIFSKDEVKECCKTFFKMKLNHALNLDHNEKNKANGYIFQSYLVDSSKGIEAPNGLKNIEDGTWIIAAQIEDDELWQKIKDQTYKGFSVEGRFIELLEEQGHFKIHKRFKEAEVTDEDVAEIDEMSEQDIQDLIDLVDQLQELQNLSKKQNN